MKIHVIVAWWMQKTHREWANDTSETWKASLQIPGLSCLHVLLVAAGHLRSEHPNIQLYMCVILTVSADHCSDGIRCFPWPRCFVMHTPLQKRRFVCCSLAKGRSFWYMSFKPANSSKLYESSIHRSFMVLLSMKQASLSPRNLPIIPYSLFGGLDLSASCTAVIMMASIGKFPSIYESSCPKGASMIGFSMPAFCLRVIPSQKTWVLRLWELLS